MQGIREFQDIAIHLKEHLFNLDFINILHLKTLKLLRNYKETKPLWEVCG